MENPPQTAPAEQAVQPEYTDISFTDIELDMPDENTTSAGDMYNVGNCYRYGYGIVKNYSEAVKWYRKAAEQGNAKAQYNLGSCYYNGKALSKIIQKP